MRRAVEFKQYDKRGARSTRQSGVCEATAAKGIHPDDIVSSEVVPPGGDGQTNKDGSVLNRSARAARTLGLMSRFPVRISESVVSGTPVSLESWAWESPFSSIRKRNASTPESSGSGSCSSS